MTNHHYNCRNLIPHNKPTLEREEEEAAMRVIRSGWIAKGPEVDLFEQEFCKFLDIPKDHAVAVSSGTAALFLALWSLEADNKEIAMPVYTCSILQSCIQMIGGKELLMDVSKNTPNIDIKRLKKLNPQISIVPHMYGIPVDLNHMNHHIIEDCAQALGAKVGAKYVGLQGDIGIFSFHATKLMTSGGQGGMVVSKNRDLIEKIKEFSEYGTQSKKLKFNFEMTDLQAAIGREQLKKLPRFLKRRAEIFDQYVKAGLELLDVKPEEKNKLFPVRFRAIMKTKNSKHIIELLAKNGIRATVLIDELGLLGNKNLFPNTFPLITESISLPIYPSLTDDDLDKIISLLTK